MHPNDTTQEVPHGYCHCGCGRLTWIADKTWSKYGWIKGQPTKFVRGHGNKRPSIERFWFKVDKRGSDECWEWQGGKDQDGYGSFWYDGKTRRAHRYSYILHHGPISNGMLVCHSCDNSSCVNPRHLFQAPPAINSKDMASKGRAAKGEQHGMTPLTSKQVIEIRRLSASHRLSQEAIAQQFGVDQTTVSRIWLRKSWAHV